MVNVLNPQACLYLKKPWGNYESLEWEAHEVLWFSHGTPSLNVIVTQRWKFTGNVVKTVLWGGKWTVSLPKKRNGSLQERGNSTAFPKPFTFQHQSRMRLANFLDPRLIRGPQSQDLFPAISSSAIWQGQASWKKGLEAPWKGWDRCERVSEPLPDEHTIKSLSTFKASYSLPKNISINKKKYYHNSFFVCKVYLNNFQPLIIYFESNFPSQTLMLLKWALLI